jgi:hypothetical protein
MRPLLGVWATLSLLASSELALVKEAPKPQAEEAEVPNVIVTPGEPSTEISYTGVTRRSENPSGR